MKFVYMNTGLLNFRKFERYLQILGASRVTWRNFQSQDLEFWRNLRTKCCLGFLLATCELLLYTITLITMFVPT